MTNVRRQMKIPLSEMKISKLNMRHERKKPLIVDILPSVEKDGILQPLLVRREGDHWGVVAGRRRWWCLKTLAKKSGKPLYAPCLVLAPNDDAGAVEASLMENIGRLPPTEMQQYEAFGRLAAEGRSIGDIAHQFGITELSVRRVLALANLASEIRALYASDDITRETAQALTLASSDQQTEWLRLYADKSERAPEGRRCKAWIAGGEKISVEHALFDLAEYDGAVLDDLFGDDAIFADAPTFWKAQSAAIASRVEAYLADGWSEVQVMERGDYFSSYQYRSRTKKRGGKVYISVSYSGAASFHEGFITEQEASKLDKASASNDATATPIKPDMSGPMEQYVMRHRHAAAGAALLSDPAIGFRLAVTHMIAGSANWNVGVGRLPKTKEATTKSVDGSKAVMALSKEAAAVEKLLTNHGFIAATKPARGDDTHLCNAFSALLKMNDAEVMRVQAFVVAKTLECGSASVEAVLHVTDCQISDWWAPDDAFFETVRDKRVINAMLADIAGSATAKAHLTDTGKAQKEIIANRLRGTGGHKSQADWRPDCMKVPPSRLLPKAPNLIVARWEAIAGFFKSKARNSAPVDLAKPTKRAA